MANKIIEINSRWTDGFGLKITVKNIVGNRVYFIRDGYGKECCCAVDRLTREFMAVPENRSILPISYGSDGWDKGIK